MEGRKNRRNDHLSIFPCVSDSPTSCQHVFCLTAVEDRLFILFLFYSLPLSSSQDILARSINILPLLFT